MVSCFRCGKKRHFMRDCRDDKSHKAKFTASTSGALVVGDSAGSLSALQKDFRDDYLYHRTSEKESI